MEVLEDIPGDGFIGGAGGARNATRGVDPRREGCMANHANFGTGQPKHKEWISGGPEGI